ncbi:hypothetical protein WJX72_011484 [[Myrmecia] bisecta]|uniref:TrmE-type G domain-containing protein n=1 Tax=[Myrmecia] bisecta TaxID=41462 RepID=A0AAW1PXX4_9CHLO
MSSLAGRNAPAQTAAAAHRQTDATAVLQPADNAAAGNQGSADTDTIAAIVTGAQQGSVAIIRLSGTDAVHIAGEIFCRSAAKGPSPGASWRPKTHRVYHGHVLAAAGNILDEVLLLAMLAPKSYTAEDVIELHCHGGSVCVRRVLQRCLEAGARLAAPGEFTLRAFLNGRLDLAQAESVAQLVDARTAAAADSALGGLAGGIGSAVSTMRHETLELLAELEARLDFDEDLPTLDIEEWRRRIGRLQGDVSAALATARQGQLLRKGLQVALVGRPNVGKSSILNSWSGTDRAIVTEIAGTTRDIVEAGVVISGVPVTLLDTAGLRDAADVVERIGVERSRAAAQAADIVIWVIDSQAGWTGEDDLLFHALWGEGPGSATCRLQAPALLACNKCDLVQHAATMQLGHTDAPQSSSRSSSDGASSTADSRGSARSSSGNGSVPECPEAAFKQVLRVSAATGAGMQELQEAVLALAGSPGMAAGGMSWAVNERQAEALLRAQEALAAVADSMAAQLPIDFWTIDLRTALRALGEVSGEEVSEDVLDNVFSRFCIGK